MRFGQECNKWHRWFAWYPVWVSSGVYVWGEYVWRKDNGRYDSFYVYRALEEGDPI